MALEWDPVDGELDRRVPGWREDWWDKAMAGRAKAAWRDKYPTNLDGSPQHFEFVIDYMARANAMDIGQIERLANHLSGGVYRPPGSSKRLERIRAQEAEKAGGPDQYLGEGQNLRLMRPEEVAAIEQRNRSRHRFMTPEEYRRQQDEADQRKSKFTYKDPNERDEHEGLVSHSIPVSGAVGDTRTRR